MKSFEAGLLGGMGGLGEKENSVEVKGKRNGGREQTVNDSV